MMFPLRSGLLIALAISAICGAGPSVAMEEVSAAAAFRTLRAEGVAAANANDLETAAAKFAEADRLIVNHPGLILLQARVAMAAGDSEKTISFLDRYAQLGLNFNVAANPAFAEVAATPAFSPVAARLAMNLVPVGAAESVFAIDRPFVAEGLAWDERRSRYLVSGIHARTILQVNEEGLASEYLLDKAVPGVLGLVIDPERQVLWAAAAGQIIAADLPPEMKDRTELLKIDLASGEILARFSPDGDAPRNFGDVALGPDGSAYVSDSRTGEIFRVRPAGEALELLIPAGLLASPQGMVVTPDGSAMIVSDYSSGLHRIDLATGGVSPIPGAENQSLIGIDALVQRDQSLIAVQNGVNPQRVLRLDMDQAWSRFLAVSVLAANLESIDEPTGAVVVDGDVVFVSRSQTTAFDPTGALKNGPPPPAGISRLTGGEGCALAPGAAASW